MLRKLIKYDLKSMGRIMVPLWLTTIVLFVLSVLYQQFQTKDFDDTMNVLFVLVLVVLFFVIMVLNIFFVIQRFWNGLLKEEGYLMFTIPVSTRKLILSKVISSMMITVGSVMTILIIIVITNGMIEGSVLEDIEINLTPDAIIETISLFAALITSIYFAYAAMAIGQLSNRNRLVCSFGAYVGLHIVEIAIATAGSFVLFTFLRGMIKYLPDSVILIAPLVATIVEIIILHAITELLLTKKLNLE